MDARLKYIFLAGAPGSKWSSISMWMDESPSIDHSDFSKKRTHWHTANGKYLLAHTGVYFDPGMEFGNGFEDLSLMLKADIEREFNRPFSQPDRIKIIKSHVFSYQLDFLKDNWPDEPIVIVYRPNAECLDWWLKCGGFNITYPDYRYYVDIENMKNHIEKQNAGILKFIENNDVVEVIDTIELADQLGIPTQLIQYKSYLKLDARVYLYWSKKSGR